MDEVLSFTVDVVGGDVVVFESFDELCAPKLLLLVVELAGGLFVHCSVFEANCANYYIRNSKLAP